MSDDAYRYSDSVIGYLLMMTPPWAVTAVSFHPLLFGGAAAARRRFVCQGTGMRAEGATIIEVSILENAPWYSPTGRMWWPSSDPCCGIRKWRVRPPADDRSSIGQESSDAARPVHVRDRTAVRRFFP